jgi:hypothetical protein
MRILGASPFVIRAEGPWSFRLVLWGSETERVAEWIVGLERAGQRGVGRGRGRARLRGVAISGRDVFDGERIRGPAEPLVFESHVDDAASLTDVEVRLVSPLRICRDGRPERGVTGESLFAALGRRADRVAMFESAPEGACAYQPAFEGGCVATTRYVDRMRYSSRQGRAVGLGGVVGVLKLSHCRAVDRAWLRFGATFGVGKATAMGCGAIDVTLRD